MSACCFESSLMYSFLLSTCEEQKCDKNTTFAHHAKHLLYFYQYSRLGKEAISLIILIEVTLGFGCYWKGVLLFAHTRSRQFSCNLIFQSQQFVESWSQYSVCLVISNANSQYMQMQSFVFFHYSSDRKAVSFCNHRFTQVRHQIVIRWNRQFCFNYPVELFSWTAIFIAFARVFIFTHLFRSRLLESIATWLKFAICFNEVCSQCLNWYINCRISSSRNIKHKFIVNRSFEDWKYRSFTITL